MVHIAAVKKHERTLTFKVVLHRRLSNNLAAYLSWSKFLAIPRGRDSTTK